MNRGILKKFRELADRYYMRSLLVKILPLTGLLAMSCGRTQTAPEKDDTSGSSTTADDDKPDQSAPVSGAYLTCLAPEPTADMDYMVAGCQLRDGQHRHISDKSEETRWAFAPGEGKTGPAIEVYDLYDKSQHYFDAMFVMRFAKGAGLQEVNRLAAIDYFLSSVPVLAPKSILLSSVKKSGSLNLLAAGGEEVPEPKKPEPMTFRRHNTAVDTERTMPAEPVAGIRQRPYVLPQVVEINHQPVLPAAAAATPSGPQSLVLSPEQQSQQQQQVQNQLNAQMFSTLISGATSAIAKGAASAPAQTGVVSGPPPAAAGGCTCQN